jgi:hypothetical protein
VVRTPLKEGSGSKIRGENVGELMSTYENKGKIGSATPKNKKHALEIALAIAYDKARESKK